MEAKPPERCSKFMISTLALLLLYTVLFLCGFGSPDWASETTYGLRKQVGLWKSCYDEKQDDRSTLTTCLNTDAYLKADGLIHWVHGLYICVILALITLIAAIVVLGVFVISPDFNKNLIGLWIPICGLVTSAFLSGISGVIFAVRTLFEFDLRNMDIGWGCICTITALPVGLVMTTILFFEFHLRTSALAKKKYRNKASRSVLSQPRVPLATGNIYESDNLNTNVEKAIHAQKMEELRSSHLEPRKTTELQPLKSNDYCETQFRRHAEEESFTTPNEGEYATIDNYNREPRDGERPSHHKGSVLDYDTKHDTRKTNTEPPPSTSIFGTYSSHAERADDSDIRGSNKQSEDRIKQTNLFSRNMNVSFSHNDNTEQHEEPTSVENTGIKIPSWAAVESKQKAVNDLAKKPGGKLVLEPIASSSKENRGKRHKHKRKNNEYSELPTITNSRDDATEQMSKGTVSGVRDFKDSTNVSKGTVAGVKDSKDSLADVNTFNKDTRENDEYEKSSPVGDKLNSSLKPASSKQLHSMIMSQKLSDPIREALENESIDATDKPQPMRRKYKDKTMKQKQAAENNTDEKSLRKSRDTPSTMLLETHTELVMDALEVGTAPDHRQRSYPDSNITAPDERKKTKVRRSSQDYSRDSHNKEKSETVSTPVISPTELPPVRLSKRKKKKVPTATLR